MTEGSAQEAAVAWRHSRVGGVDTVRAEWDFAVRGGSFGVHDADAFGAAVAAAVAAGAPLVTVLRSGGTRLTEGMRALVGIPRAVLALQTLAAARLPHISVCDNPTTGGIWVAVGSVADVRIGVRGATVGFSGPRVVEAMTGRPPAAGVGTAEAAYDAGLLDLLVDLGDVDAAIATVLGALRPTAADSRDHGHRRGAESDRPGDDHDHEATDGWEQVQRSRAADRSDGERLALGLVRDGFRLRGTDPTVAAVVGRLDALPEMPAVVVAMAAQRDVMPGRNGFRLLARAARLADRLGIPLITLVDTPGADPHTELDGLAPAIAEAMAAVLTCRAPTISLVHGAGGSGGALAAAVTDVVGVSEHGWFAALGPEGAAAALRRSPAEATRAMRVTPAELMADGFADAYVPSTIRTQWLVATADRLSSASVSSRLAARHRRWSRGLEPDGD